MRIKIMMRANEGVGKGVDEGEVVSKDEVKG